MTKTLRAAGAVLLLAVLAACSSAQQAKLPTPDEITSTAQSITQTTGAVLTATQEGMCLAQSMANTASGIAQIAGKADDAANAQKASEAAGLGCNWTPPVKPAS